MFGLEAAVVDEVWLVPRTVLPSSSVVLVRPGVTTNRRKDG